MQPIYSLCAFASLYLCVKFLHFGGFLPHIRCDGTDNCDAADTAGPSAALAPFQRIQPSFSRHENVNSAVSPVLPASHFSGKYAKYAQIAIFSHLIDL